MTSQGEQPNSALPASKRQDGNRPARKPFTAEMRETMRMMYEAGCTFKEIATDLEINEEWARSKAYRLGMCTRRALNVERIQRLQQIAVGEAVSGLSDSVVSHWLASLHKRGYTIKRFASTNGTFGLRRIA